MSRVQVLKQRALMLQKARAFFEKRGVLELDCPALIQNAPIDSNIDCIQTDQDGGFLHTSPEYCLKRLLADGIGDCYYLGHVFRKQEIGSLHNPEFTMVEWYRLNFSFEEMIQETAEFLFLFFPKCPIEILPFQEAFTKYVGIDIDKADLKELQKASQHTSSSWERNDYIDYLMTHKIEPNLGKNGLSVIIDYPPDQAALATLKEKKGKLRAERFEIYHQGIELANGYHELSDAKELQKRFEAINQDRIKEGKEPYTIDQKFLDAMKTLPPCCGVALGFDRAFMIHAKKKSLKEVIPFAWQK